MLCPAPGQEHGGCSVAGTRVTMLAGSPCPPSGPKPARPGPQPWGLRQAQQCTASLLAQWGLGGGHPLGRTVWPLGPHQHSPDPPKGATSVPMCPHVSPGQGRVGRGPVFRRAGGYEGMGPVTAIGGWGPLLAAENSVHRAGLPRATGAPSSETGTWPRLHLHHSGLASAFRAGGPPGRGRGLGIKASRGGLSPQLSPEGRCCLPILGCPLCTLQRK